jgi:hypothetical protein
VYFDEYLACSRLLRVLTAAERRTLDRVLKRLLIELERTQPRS